jgi:hypothetical protein
MLDAGGGRLVTAFRRAASIAGQPGGADADAAGVAQAYLPRMRTLRRFVLLLVVFVTGGLAGIIVHAHHWQTFAAEATGGEARIEVALDNPRLTVQRVEMGPGARRQARTRATDELVLFCEQARYEVEADGHREARDRKPGTLVWHNKGDLAPTLVNPGGRPLRYYSIELK